MKQQIQILGIVNLTDDSYYAPSRAKSCEAFMDRVRTLVAEGADIIDIGACSTRPGSQPVGAEEEWRRLEPALQGLRCEFPELPVSIDTYWASVVEHVHDAIGPFIVNDISAGAYDGGMLPTVGRLAEAGISDWILDPGFGFAKTVEQNWTLLEEMDKLQELQKPILVGISRKSMIYRRFGITPEESLPATQVAHYMALQRGATYLRVHDVAEARRTIDIYSRI